MSGEPHSTRHTRPPLLPPNAATANRLAATPANWPPRPTQSTTVRKIATPAPRIAPNAAPTPSSIAAPAGMGAGASEGIGNLDFAKREELRDIFDRIDHQALGHIPVSRIPEILRVFGVGDQPPETWAQWRQQLDPERSGRIGYSRLEEFVSLRVDEMSQRQEILHAFRLFKPDAADPERARITVDDLRKISAHLGEHIPDEELLEMINIADIDGNGSVGFVDFMRIMRKSGLF
ncbi:centrin, EF-hand protein [Coemansia helicoidea]|uniref:Centrin, EF-hand protein n=1 Tax=Coemansia helicoidea TaxID=1286919 RepID=A0ACC1L946_9FUNG|nr:centrin, EF-hand protein [Coemansia helicoidea]